MTETEYWVEQKAKGSYRDKGWETNTNLPFNKGEAVVFDPFSETGVMYPVFCTFVKYHGEDNQIAEIRVPTERARESHASDKRLTLKRGWFREKAGNYLVHSRYLTPQ